MNTLRAKWDAHYQQAEPAVAANVLLQHRCLLPAAGNALDLACGLGANALLMAEHGLAVEAWDISAVALQHLQAESTRRSLQIAAKQCEITSALLEPNSFNVIVISRFLDRSLSNAIMTALKKDGLLFYQTFSRNKINSAGPNNPNYLLAENELLQLFAPLALVFYQEYARIGDILTGDRNEAYYIGRKL
jgi:tellurite methyltransferase